jgi:hypothetical protein
LKEIKECRENLKSYIEIKLFQARWGCGHWTLAYTEVAQGHGARLGNNLGLNRMKCLDKLNNHKSSKKKAGGQRVVIKAFKGNQAPKVLVDTSHCRS